jgi:[ribosomal protein S5]-alanine N-acetyltransferase
MIDNSFEKKTRRLVVRQFREDDYDLWKETYLNLPKAKNKWDSGPREKKDLTRAQFKKVLTSLKKNCSADSYYDLFAFDKKIGAIVGHISLMDISRAIFQNAYLGYGILSPHWGKGYGYEMAKAGIEIAFKVLKLHRVEAGIDPSNKRSIALAKKLEMRREGLSKRRLFLNHEWVDIAIYALTAEEFGVKGARGSAISNRG